MSNTPNYYIDMKETLQEQRKNRIGRNDYRRNMRANRQNNRAILCVAAAAVLFLFSASLSAQNISEEKFIETQAWKKECQRYFFFKDPRIVYYKEYAPTVWCSIESQKILKGEVPFNYKKDTK